MKDILREILAIMAHCTLISLFIINLLVLLSNYGHWLEIVIVDTIVIPLMYLIVFIACKVGDTNVKEHK